MNAEQTELFRLAVLRVLNTNRSRFGLGVVSIGHTIRMYNFSPPAFGGEKEFHDAILDEIQYLTDKGFVEEVEKNMSAENRRWRLTSNGFAFVDKS